MRVLSLAVLLYLLFYAPLDAKKPKLYPSVQNSSWTLETKHRIKDWGGRIKIARQLVIEFGPLINELGWGTFRETLILGPDESVEYYPRFYRQEGKRIFVFEGQALVGNLVREDLQNRWNEAFLEDTGATANSSEVEVWRTTYRFTKKGNLRYREVIKGTLDTEVARRPIRIIRKYKGVARPSS